MGEGSAQHDVVHQVDVLADAVRELLEQGQRAAEVAQGEWSDAIEEQIGNVEAELTGLPGFGAECEKLRLMSRIAWDIDSATKGTQAEQAGPPKPPAPAKPAAPPKPAKPKAGSKQGKDTEAEGADVKAIITKAEKALGRNLPDNYRAHWRSYARWCAKQKIDLLPIDADDIARYVEEKGRKLTANYMQGALSAIAQVHKALKMPNPVAAKDSPGRLALTKLRKRDQAKAARAKAEAEQAAKA